MTEAVAVNLKHRLLLLETQEVIPITTFHDADGVECEAQDATGLVAGPTMRGKWCHVDLTGFEPAPIQ